jgi:hypothetical protein
MAITNWTVNIGVCCFSVNINFHFFSIIAMPDGNCILSSQDTDKPFSKIAIYFMFLVATWEWLSFSTLQEFDIVIFPIFEFWEAYSDASFYL